MKENNTAFSHDEMTNDRHKLQFILYIKTNWKNIGSGKYYLYIDGICNWRTVKSKLDGKYLFAKIEKDLYKENNFDCRVGFYIKARSGKTYVLKDRENKTRGFYISKTKFGKSSKISRDIIFDETKHVIGSLCHNNHDYKGTGGSMRTKRNSTCVECNRLYQKERYIDRMACCHIYGFMKIENDYITYITIDNIMDEKYEKIFFNNCPLCGNEIC